MNGLNGYQFTSNIIDHRTRMVSLKALKEKMDAYEHYHEASSQYGAPVTLFTDNGIEFINNLYKMLCARQLTLHRRIPS